MLSKKPEIRNSSDIETVLLPILKRSDYYKSQRIKEADLIEIASLLKYEFQPKDTNISDLGMLKTYLKRFRGIRREVLCHIKWNGFDSECKWDVWQRFVSWPLLNVSLRHDVEFPNDEDEPRKLIISLQEVNQSDGTITLIISYFYSLIWILLVEELVLAVIPTSKG